MIPSVNAVILYKSNMNSARLSTDNTFHHRTNFFFFSLSLSQSIHLSSVPWYWWGRPLLGLKLSHNRLLLRSFCSKLDSGSFPSMCEPETPALLAGLVRLLEYGNETDFTRSSLYENALRGRSIDSDCFCNTLDWAFASFGLRSFVNLDSLPLRLLRIRCGE